MAKVDVPNQNEFLQIVNQIYKTMLNGIPNVSKPVSVFANEYLEKYKDKSIASQKLATNQIYKCTTSGFLTGFGGTLTLPVSISANFTSVIYVQMRMIAAIAYINGYDLNSDETQTFVYACLVGVSANKLVKQTAIKFGVKLSKNLVKKIPGRVLTQINKAVGFRFLTKFGSKGLVNIGKLVPVVGAIIGGAVDYAETKVIAKRAIQWFVNDDFRDGYDDLKLYEEDFKM